MKYGILIFFALLGPLIYWGLDDTVLRQAAKAVAVTDVTSDAAADPWSGVVLNKRAAPSLNGRDRWTIRTSGETSDDTRDHYNLKLLHLILDKTTARFGPYRLVTGENYNRLRAFTEVIDGHLDVTWNVTTRIHEKALTAVPREMVRGFHGYRVLLIRQGDQPRFSQVHTAADLRALTAGGGYEWQPTAVWRANQLPIVTSDSYAPLFEMLHYGRFDYMSRALFEPHGELALHPDLNLALEQELLVYFKASCFYFVHPSRPDLLERLTLGMDLAMADGSFDQLFTSVPEFAALKQTMHLRRRRLIPLATPERLATSVLDRAKFYFTPQELIRRYP